MELILLSVAGFVTGAVLAYVTHKARREEQAREKIKEANRAKWRKYAAAKRERRKAARVG